MNLSQFPSKFNSESQAKEQRNINTARTEKNNKENNINRGRSSGTRFGESISGGASIGSVAGLVACFTHCDSMEDSFAYFISFIILGCILGFVWYILAWIISTRLNASADKNIQKAQNNLEEQEKNIKESAEKERRDYLKAFEEEVQRRSVKFADSTLAQEVISWMSEGFYRNIDSSDRRSHIETISVPFLFSVYANKITCNIGTYDFELKRCENLESAIDQTALARAIASTIQLNVIMKYPKDVSGTEMSITIEYTYNDDRVNALISYVAPNGYYKAVKNW